MSLDCIFKHLVDDKVVLKMEEVDEEFDVLPIYTVRSNICSMFEIEEPMSVRFGEHPYTRRYTTLEARLEQLRIRKFSFVNLSLTTRVVNGSAEVELKLWRNFGEKSIIIKDLKFTTLKKILPFVSAFSTHFDGFIPAYFCSKTAEYRELGELLQEHFVRSLGLQFAQNVAGRKLEIVDLFPMSTEILLYTTKQQFAAENEAVISRLQSLTCQEEVPRDLVENALRNNSLRLMDVRLEQFFPLDQYIEEWKNGFRTIHKWHLASGRDSFPVTLSDQVFQRANDTKTLTMSLGRTGKSSFFVILEESWPDIE